MFTLLLLALAAPAPPSDMEGFELRHGGAVLCVRFSGDGKLLATSTDKGEVALWDVATGKLVRKMAGHKKAATALDVSKDGKLLVSGDYSGRLVVWDTSTGKPKYEATTKSGIAGITLSRDGKSLHAASGEAAHKFLLGAGLTALGNIRVEALKGSVHGVALSPDGPGLLVVSQTVLNEGSAWTTVSQLKLTPAPPTIINTRRGDTQPTAAMKKWQGHRALAVWSPDGKSWAAVTEAAVLIGEKGKLATGFGVVGIAFTRDGKGLFTAKSDGTVRLFDLATRKEAASLKGLGKLTALAISPDGKRLALARADGKVIVRAVPRPKEKK
jgi:WD40 repeat protein